MDKKNLSPHPYEPVPDELPAKPVYHFDIDRRKFFKMTGGGLVVIYVLSDVFSYSSSAAPSQRIKVAPEEVENWIHINEDGKITVYTGKVEVGQNIRTSLSQIVAEELMAPLSSIIMIMGDTDLVPYDAGTFGSRTTPQMGSQLRKAAAMARESLIEMAAAKWNTGINNLKADSGMIIHTVTKEKISYGALTKGQKMMKTISDKVSVKTAGEWTIAGQSVPKVDERKFISGKHVYVSDMKLPGMLYGKVLRPPSYGAKLLNIDISKAKNMEAVVVVKDGDFIGVAAPDIRTATNALHAIDARWEEQKGQPSNVNIFEYLVNNISEESRGRNSGVTKGDIEKGLAEADFRHSARYHIDYIAHVPLEPRAAMAEWNNGKLTVWTGTQRPFGVQQELVQVFNIEKEKVRVIMPDTGSGYGGKHSGEAAIEAARLSKEAGKPVKIVWTREEEFTWAYFRPGGVIDVEAAVKKNGSITSWKFINYNSGGAGLDTEYIVSNKKVQHIPSRTALRQGSYRGLASTANVFARECHMNDLAELIKMDPLEFRIKNLEDERLIAVLKTAAKSFGWGSPKAPGHGYGVACGFEKGGYVGTCAEVYVNGDKEVKVIRVTQAFEVGAIINPHHLENQVIGSIVQGLGGALFEAVQFADGRILNAGLSSYRVPRFTDIPKIDVILINRKDLPSAGAGEAAIIGVAPAIRNAILDATDTALNNLPMIPNGVFA